MKNTVRMTSKEIKKKYGKDRAKVVAMIKNAPVFDMSEIPELKDFKPGPVVARGFAEFKEYINRKGRPLVEDKKLWFVLNNKVI